MKLNEYLKKEYSKSAIGSYESTIKRYVLAMGSKAEQGTYSDVLDYIGLLREQNLHPKTLRNNLLAIKIYYRYLVEIGKRNDHPCQYLNLKDQLNRAIQIESLYSKKTLDELLTNHTSKRKSFQQRDEVIISLLIYQAMTVQEITALNVEDVKLKEATINAKGGSKQKARTLSLQANQILLLHSYITEDREKLLQNNKNITVDDASVLLMDKAGKRIYKGSINKIINTNRPKHDKLIALKIRQSVIAHLLKQNNDIRVVQVFAGHKRAGSTEEYKQTGLEELKAAIDKLHPLETFTQSAQN